MDDLSRFCCQNSQCPDFGLRDAGNLTVTGRLGQVPAVSLAPLLHPPRPVLRTQGYPAGPRPLCLRTRSSRSSNTSTRAVVSSRRCPWSRSIPIPSATTAAPPCACPRTAHDENSVAHSPQTRELQMDEKWSFVAKKEKNCDEDDPEDQFQGDCCDHVAFDPEHRLVVSVVPGSGRGSRSESRSPTSRSDWAAGLRS